ncbi:MAG: amidohydrolase family protein [Planctomycetota bacterium]
MQNPTDQPELQALKARYVFPATGAPIPDGLVTIQGRTIVAVGPDTPAANVRDLGNVAIVPGLVNAHTHLEFSDLAEPLGEPGMGFTDWLWGVIQSRRDVTLSPDHAVQRGLRESVRLGTTTLGEIGQPGFPSGLIADAPLDVTVFLELIAPMPERVEPAFELARQHAEGDQRMRGWRAGLSPHAPYSVHPSLLRRLAWLSHSRKIPIAMHLGESRDELELLSEGAGPLREMLIDLGAWDPAQSRGGVLEKTLLDYLWELDPASRVLVVHGNYLADREIAFLAERSDRMAVVYCPRTHAFFAHAEYPLAKLLSSGATVALGTDSRASSPDLSVLAEMRFVARRHPSVGPDTVLRLGTINGARALGRDHRLGSLEVGKYADLAVVALPDRDAADPHELLFDSNLPVVATWYRGKRVMKDEG